MSFGVDPWSDRMPKYYYTVDEAAAHLSLSTHTLNKWRCQKRGPKFIRFGKSIRYRHEDLAAFACDNCNG